ncbi:uncharacterized protein SPSC_06148 [Sporisorium scitamineum]|uniref:Uncharacterized protein n=1 Tax=Sporisorium scitamineum TaxID=49012 RepID=A0A127ZJY1_9BASI|nr:uncharacterized protein SPSC_06148 [Sporisorium scitamineum]
MFRAFAGRSLLLLGPVYLLLYATFCVAVKNDPFLEAYLQNQPHYKCYPVLNIRTEPLNTINYARESFGAVYLARPEVHAGDSFEVLYYPKYQDKADIMMIDAQQDVKRKLDAAKEAGRRYGDSARVLQYGHPFKDSIQAPPDWPVIWSNPASFKVPSSQDSPDWLTIRKSLQDNKFIVLYDEAKEAYLAFQVLLNGQVQMKFQKNTHAIHKRGLPAHDEARVSTAAQGSGANHFVNSVYTWISIYLQRIPNENTFEATNRRIYDWKAVWDKVYPIDWPSRSDSPKWIGIRKTLYDNGKVVLHDPGRSNLIAYKLNEAGVVDLEVRHFNGDLKALVHGIRKRAITGPPKDLDEAAAQDGSVNQEDHPLDEVKLRAYLENQPHYSEYPVLDMAEPQSMIEYARSKYGAVWLSKYNGRSLKPFELRFFQHGKPQSFEIKHGATSVQNLLRYAQSDGEENGDAARVLPYGKHFKSSRSVPGWHQVWNSNKLQVPSSLNSPEWSEIRGVLNQDRQVLLEDQIKEKLLAFRLDRDGKVEMQVKNLEHVAHSIRKRSLSWPARGPTPVASPNRMSSRPAIPFDEEIEAYIRGRPHFKGFPVLNKATDTAKTINYARERFGEVRLTYFGEGFPSLHGVLEQPGKPAQPLGSDTAVLEQLVKSTDLAENQYSNAARFLQFGRPFRATNVKPGKWEKVWRSQPQDVPMERNFEKWLQIPAALQQNEHVLQDKLDRLDRLDNLGRVEMKVKGLWDHLHRFRKRDVSNAAGDLKTIAPDGKVNHPKLAFDPEIEAHIQGLPHYLGYPVLNSAMETEASINYAVEKYKAAWLTGKSFRKDRTLDVTLAFQGHDAVLLDLYEESVRSLLAGAKEAEIHYGDASQLQWGKPFEETNLEPDDWEKVWSSEPRKVPSRLKPTDWLDIRDALQQNRHIVLHDLHQNLRLAFRLNKVGLVEMQFRDLAHGIFKRSEIPSAKGTSAAPLNSMVSNGAKVKQAGDKVTFFHVLLPAKDEAWKENSPELYADLFHYDGIPIFDAELEQHDLARQALRDHGSFWAYENVNWQRYIEPNPFQYRFAGRDALVDSNNNEAVFAHVQKAKRFKDVHGDVAAKLAYGAPFPSSKPPMPASSSQGWEKAAKLDSSTTSIYDARTKLKEFKRLVLENPVTGSRVGFQLEPDGKVLFQDLSSVAHRLAKRMIRPPAVTPNSYEWYGRYYQYTAPVTAFREDSSEEEGMFSRTIYHDHVPVLVANGLQEDKVHHAIKQHKYAWITGITEDGNYQKPFRVGQDERLDSNGYEQVEAQLRNAETARSTYGDTLMYLKYGQPFTPREPAAASTSRIGRLISGNMKKSYVPPSWEEVAKHGNILDLDRVHLPYFRQHLDKYGFLKAFQSDPAKTYGVRLLADGQVEIEDLANFLRPYHKRSEVPSGKGKSGASVSSGSRPLSKRMIPSGSQPRPYEYYASRYQYISPQEPLSSEASRQMFANTIHYNGVPVLFLGEFTPDKLQHALHDYHQAWITFKDAQQNPTSGTRTFQEPLHLTRSAGRDSGGWLELLNHLRAVEQVRVQYGEVPALLMHGKPFAPRRPNKIFLFGHYYSKPSFKNQVKTSTDLWDLTNSGEMYDMHKYLDDHNHLKGWYPDTQHVYGFRLDKNGKVEIRYLETLAARFHKRAVEGDVASLERSSGSRHLAKRMPRSNSESGTYDWYATDYQFKTQETLTADARERMFSDKIFYVRLPVLVAEDVGVSGVHHALQSYGGAWITSRNVHGVLREPFCLTPRGLLQAQNVKAVLRYLQEIDQYRQENGRMPMLLKYGKPFPAQQSTRYSSCFSCGKQGRKKGGAWNLINSDPYLVRQHLFSTKSMDGYDTNTNKSYRFRLLDNGQGKISDPASLGGRLHKRMDAVSSSSTNPVPHTGDRLGDPSAIEHYIFIDHPRDNSIRKLSDIERRKFFAGDLHFNGLPMFFPKDDRNVLQKIQQARQDYTGYWIVGAFAHEPQVRTASYKTDDWRFTRNVGEEELLEELAKMEEYLAQHGRDAQLLKYGPGFPKRRNHFFSNYNTPTLATVVKHAPVVETESATIAQKWSLLHDSNMLIIKDGESKIALALNKVGEVIHLPDPPVGLHKRMAPRDPSQVC